MNVILSIRSKTVKELSRESNLPVFYNNIDFNVDLLIRWGSTKRLAIEPRRTLNTIEAIEKASDKALTRKILLEQNIPVPEPSETDFPVIGRTRKHQGGSGFYFCESKNDVERAKMRGAVYFSKFFPKQEEYRVHIGSGKVILISIKEGNKNKHIWNKRKNGFKFRHIKRDVWQNDEELMELVRLAKRGVKAIGLDFGAVDILTKPINNSLPKSVISEINTAPALSPLAISKYVKYFNKEQGIE